MSAAQTLRTFRDWVPVLMFHEVVPDGTSPLPPYAITQSRLRGILRDFTERGYRSGTLEDVVSALDGDRRAHDVSGKGRKKLVLTFDDGTRDFLEYALPVLQEFNFSATLFIVTGMVGGMRAWSDLPPVPIMSADELRSLQAMGFTIGAHTVSHRRLSSLNDDEAREEIALSKQTLGDLLGAPVGWFAYPYLAENDQTRALVREAGYAGACGGLNQSHSRYYLSRVDVTAFTDRELRLRCNGLFHLTRQMIREVQHKSK
jgi:peptidoglycan/xylan/chitin deacetylase (PgdA/CDA1 family)